MRHALLAALLAAIAAPALAQEAAPTDVTPDALTWEEVPESLRRSLDGRLGRAPAQPLLRVSEAAPADATARTVDHGDLVFLQAVRPAAAVRLTGAPRRKPYGVPGSVLWAAKGPDGEYFCRLNDNSRALLTGMATGLAPTTYCYRDGDGDLRFDTLYEQTGGLRVGGLNYEPLGRDERIGEPVAYERLTAPLAATERVGLRYIGPVGGKVAADGRLLDGGAEFELVGGEGPEALSRIRRLTVRLDAEGRGRFEAANGVRFDVERVDVGGEASVRLLSGLPVGEVQVAPPPSRDDLLELLSLVLNPDGSPRRAPAP